MHRKHLKETPRSPRCGVQHRMVWAAALIAGTFLLLGISFRTGSPISGLYLLGSPWRWMAWSGVCAAIGSMTLLASAHSGIRQGSEFAESRAGDDSTALPPFCSSISVPQPHRGPDRESDRLSPVQFSVDRLHANPSVPDSSRLYGLTKRALDLALVVVWAVVFAILTPVIALAIKLDSRGPVFYSQWRVGMNGREFRIYKFRSMHTHAERNGAVWAQESDPRVTGVGRFMRRTRIDELPQLWNVARGEMSFVGPRPERPEFTRLLERELPGYGYRQTVKPGLTGWAQIRYRYASSVQDSSMKLEYDLYYVRHRSLLFDFKILVLTVPVTLHLRGW
ncbi:MAG: sugar transferase [Thermomicrobiales bacterium]